MGKLTVDFQWKDISLIIAYGDNFQLHLRD